MGENKSKQLKIINFQNIKAAQTTQYQKNNPIKKWGKDLNRHFSKENIQMANRHMKRSSMLLWRNANQNYNELSYHLIPVSMAIIKMSMNNNCWRG